jgi:hypothetical protein
MSPRNSRRSITRWIGVLALLGVLLGADRAVGFNKYLEMPGAGEATDTPAYLYANLSNADAFAELDRREIPYRKVKEKIHGVRAPIRLTGRLHGVWIHSVLPEPQRATTPFEILDARLALALHDFCAILEHHDVVEVVHFTMYRPAGELREDPNQPQTRHPGGMAIDVGALKKRNGDWLAVGPHWPGSIGSQTCGRGARKLVSRRGRELVSILCEASDQRIFHYMLSPHFNREHHDHWHLEIKPAVKWFLVN